MNNHKKKNFWNELPEAFVGLSPMDGVTDLPYRMIMAKYGHPDLIFTEFVPVEALIRGIKRAYDDFLYDEIERPIVAQIYGNEPELFYSCAQITAELGFDGLDINMGCPAKSVQSRGAGAGLIRTPELAAEIVKQARRGLDAWQKNGVEYEKMPPEAKPVRIKRILKERGRYKNEERKRLPLSVKTRIGFDSPIVKEWFSVLAKLPVDAISIHGRTLKQAYRGQASWEEIGKAVEVIKNINSEIKVVGNGDVQDRAQVNEYAEKYNVDGILIGRASFGNPWAFDLNVSRDKLGFEELKGVMLEHAKLHWKIKDHKAFVQMRRHLSDYIKGFENASQIRALLVRVSSPAELEKILETIDNPDLSTQ